MMALLGSVVEASDARIQYRSGFDGEVWMSKFIEAVKVEDYLGAKSMVLGTKDETTGQRVMHIVACIEIILAALSRKPHGLDGLAKINHLGRELVETAVRFEGWNRLMALQGFVLDDQTELDHMIQLLVASALVHLANEIN
jgi:hypothetical protein